MKRKVERKNKCTLHKEKFESIADATKDIKARNPAPNIHKCLKGQQVSAYGYYWKYLD